MPEKEKIQKMFAGISKNYDYLNCLLSLGNDKKWRKFASSKLPQGLILDVCSGTGDVAIEISKQNQVISSDFCKEMLIIGNQKIKNRNLNDVFCIQNDAENLSFKDNTFSGAIVAFGIRNVSNRKKALSEMSRVVKKDGKIVILEFSKPENRLFKAIYYFYFKRILPIVGALVSKHDSAYSYLPSSVMEFPEREKFVELMKESGIDNVELYNLTYGIVTVYVGIKSAIQL